VAANFGIPVKIRRASRIVVWCTQFFTVDAGWHEALTFPRPGCMHSSRLSCGSHPADGRVPRSATGLPPASCPGKEEAVEYNLLEEKWIPVLWKDGHSNRVGIIEALTR